MMEALDMDDTKVNLDDLEKKLRNVIEEDLLPIAHRHPDKRKLALSTGKIRFACPYCGDSEQDMSAKRGNLYLKNLFYVCYNCNKKTPFLQLLEDYSLDGLFTLAEKKGLNDIKVESAKSNFRKNIVQFSFKDTYKKHLWSRDQVKSLYGFEEVTRYDRITGLLRSRRVKEYLWNRFLFDYRNNHLICLNCDTDGEHIISFQKRKLGIYKKNKYLSENFSMIAAKALERKGYKVELSQDAMDFMDTLSIYLNIQNIHTGMPMLVFEGVFDAYMFNNSISMSSAGNLIHQKFLYYVMDDDETGKKQAIEMLDSGSYVFLWKKFKRQHPEYKFDDDGNRIKDMNEVFKKASISEEYLIKNFFSNSKLMKIWI